MMRSGWVDGDVRRGTTALPMAIPPMKLARIAATDSADAPTTSVTRWNQTSS